MGHFKDPCLSPLAIIIFYFKFDFRRTKINQKMKKTLFLLLIMILFTAYSYGQFTKVGGALSYNTGYFINDENFRDHKTGNPVISATGIYEISLPWHIKPSINVFIPRINKEDFVESSEKTVISAFSLDIDGHYVFNYLDRFELYGLAGLNIIYARRKSKFDFVGGGGESILTEDTALGLNLGAGSYIKIKEEFDLFVELKAIIGRQVQGVFTAGILLNIDWMKEHEDSIL